MSMVLRGMHVDISHPMGKLLLSLILYQGGSSTTIRLYVRTTEHIRTAVYITKLDIIYEMANKRLEFL